MVVILPTEPVEDGKGPGPIELLDGGPAWHRAGADAPAASPDGAEGDPSRLGASKPEDGPKWFTDEMNIDELLERTEGAVAPKFDESAKGMEKIPPTKKFKRGKEGSG
jgi:hypothetical protein